ncbi:hypothetical protein FQA39_LY09043 [Lamprigera yunnana]|nr:hypothetical protein FQA39_LY09043 [Lamprigera yunnana]
MHTGKKLVQSYIGDLNKVSDSYTASLQEFSDKFAIRVQYDVDESLKLCKNVITCSKSGKLTSLYEQYLKQVVLPYFGDNLFLFIVKKHHPNASNEYPLSRALFQLFTKYVELEYDVLYHSGLHSVKYQQLAEDRILRYLLWVLCDPTNGRSKVSKLNYSEASIVKCLFVLRCVQPEYKHKENLIETLMNKLLTTLNVMNEVQDIYSGKVNYLTLQTEVGVPKMKIISKELGYYDSLRNSSDDESIWRPIFDTDMEEIRKEDDNINGYMKNEYSNRSSNYKSATYYVIDDEDSDNEMAGCRAVPVIDLDRYNIKSIHSSLERTNGIKEECIIYDLTEDYDEEIPDTNSAICNAVYAAITGRQSYNTTFDDDLSQLGTVTKAVTEISEDQECQAPEIRFETNPSTKRIDTPITNKYSVKEINVKNHENLKKDFEESKKIALNIDTINVKTNESNEKPNYECERISKNNEVIESIQCNNNNKIEESFITNNHEIMKDSECSNENSVQENSNKKFEKLEMVEKIDKSDKIIESVHQSNVNEAHRSSNEELKEIDKVTSKIGYCNNESENLRKVCTEIVQCHNFTPSEIETNGFEENCQVTVKNVGCNSNESINISQPSEVVTNENLKNVTYNDESKESKTFPETTNEIEEVSRDAEIVVKNIECYDGNWIEGFDKIFPVGEVTNVNLKKSVCSIEREERITIQKTTTESKNVCQDDEIIVENIDCSSGNWIEGYDKICGAGDITTNVNVKNFKCHIERDESKMLQGTTNEIETNEIEEVSRDAEIVVKNIECYDGNWIEGFDKIFPVGEVTNVNLKKSVCSIEREESITIQKTTTESKNICQDDEIIVENIDCSSGNWIEGYDKICGAGDITTNVNVKNFKCHIEREESKMLQGTTNEIEKVCQDDEIMVENIECVIGNLNKGFEKTSYTDDITTNVILKNVACNHEGEDESKTFDETRNKNEEVCQDDEIMVENIECYDENWVEEFNKISQVGDVITNINLKTSGCSIEIEEIKTIQITSDKKNVCQDDEIIVENIESNNRKSNDEPDKTSQADDIITNVTYKDETEQSKTNKFEEVCKADQILVENVECNNGKSNERFDTITPTDDIINVNLNIVTYNDASEQSKTFDETTYEFEEVCQEVEIVDENIEKLDNIRQAGEVTTNLKNVTRNDESEQSKTFDETQNQFEEVGQENEIVDENIEFDNIKNSIESFNNICQVGEVITNLKNVMHNDETEQSKTFDETQNEFEEIGQENEIVDENIEFDNIKNSIERFDNICQVGEIITNLKNVTHNNETEQSKTFDETPNEFEEVCHKDEIMVENIECNNKHLNDGFRYISQESAVTTNVNFKDITCNDDTEERQLLDETVNEIESNELENACQDDRIIVDVIECNSENSNERFSNICQAGEVITIVNLKNIHNDESEESKIFDKTPNEFDEVCQNHEIVYENIEYNNESSIEVFNNISQTGGIITNVNFKDITCNTDTKESQFHDESINEIETNEVEEVCQDESIIKDIECNNEDLNEVLDKISQAAEVIKNINLKSATNNNERETSPFDETLNKIETSEIEEVCQNDEIMVENIECNNQNSNDGISNISQESEVITNVNFKKITCNNDTEESQIFDETVNKIESNELENICQDDQIIVEIIECNSGNSNDRFDQISQACEVITNVNLKNMHNDGTEESKIFDETPNEFEEVSQNHEIVDENIKYNKETSIEVFNNISQTGEVITNVNFKDITCNTDTKESKFLDESINEIETNDVEEVCQDDQSIIEDVQCNNENLNEVLDKISQAAEVIKNINLKSATDNDEREKSSFDETPNEIETNELEEVCQNDEIMVGTVDCDNTNSNDRLSNISQESEVIRNVNFKNITCNNDTEECQIFDETVNEIESNELENVCQDDRIIVEMIECNSGNSNERFDDISEAGNVITNVNLQKVTCNNENEGSNTFQETPIEIERNECDEVCQDDPTIVENIECDSENLNDESDGISQVSEVITNVNLKYVTGNNEREKSKTFDETTMEFDVCQNDKIMVENLNEEFNISQEDEVITNINLENIYNDESEESQAFDETHNVIATNKFEQLCHDDRVIVERIEYNNDSSNKGLDNTFQVGDVTTNVYLKKLMYNEETQEIKTFDETPNEIETNKCEHVCQDGQTIVENIECNRGNSVEEIDTISQAYNDETEERITFSERPHEIETNEFEEVCEDNQSTIQDIECSNENLNEDEIITHLEVASNIEPDNKTVENICGDTSVNITFDDEFDKVDVEHQQYKNYHLFEDPVANEEFTKNVIYQLDSMLKDTDPNVAIEQENEHTFLLHSKYHYENDIPIVSEEVIEENVFSEETTEEDKNIPSAQEDEVLIQEEVALFQEEAISIQEENVVLVMEEHSAESTHQVANNNLHEENRDILHFEDLPECDQVVITDEYNDDGHFEINTEENTPTETLTYQNNNQIIIIDNGNEVEVDSSNVLETPCEKELNLENVCTNDILTSKVNSELENKITDLNETNKTLQHEELKIIDELTSKVDNCIKSNSSNNSHENIDEPNKLVIIENSNKYEAGNNEHFLHELNTLKLSTAQESECDNVINNYALTKPIVAETCEVFPNHNCSNNLDFLATYAIEREKIESKNVEGTKKSKRGQKKLKDLKQTETIDSVPRRVTRSNSAKLSLLPIKDTADSSKCTPSNFMNLEHLVTPPPICVYDLISNTNTDDENSSEPFNSIKDLEEIPLKNVAYDEDTIDDGITLMSHECSINNEVLIGTPESKSDEIVSDTEGLSNTNLSFSTSEQLCKELKLTMTKNVMTVEDTKIKEKLPLPKNKKNVGILPIKKRKGYEKHRHESTKQNSCDEADKKVCTLSEQKNVSRTLNQNETLTNNLFPIKTKVKSFQAVNIQYNPYVQLQKMSFPCTSKVRNKSKDNRNKKKEGENKELSVLLVDAKLILPNAVSKDRKCRRSTVDFVSSASINENQKLVTTSKSKIGARRTSVRSDTGSTSNCVSSHDLPLATISKHQISETSVILQKSKIGKLQTSTIAAKEKIRHSKFKGEGTAPRRQMSERCDTSTDEEKLYVDTEVKLDAKSKPHELICVNNNESEVLASTQMLTNQRNVDKEITNIECRTPTDAQNSKITGKRMSLRCIANKSDVIETLEKENPNENTIHGTTEQQNSIEKCKTPIDIGTLTSEKKHKVEHIPRNIEETLTPQKLKPARKEFSVQDTKGIDNGSREEKINTSQGNKEMKPTNSINQENTNKGGHEKNKYFAKVQSMKMEENQISVEHVEENSEKCNVIIEEHVNVAIKRNCVVVQHVNIKTNRDKQHSNTKKKLKINQESKENRQEYINTKKETNFTVPHDMKTSETAVQSTHTECIDNVQQSENRSIESHAIFKINRGSEEHVRAEAKGAANSANVKPETLSASQSGTRKKHYENRKEIKKINEKNLKDDSTIPQHTNVDGQQSENMNPKEPTPLNVIQKNTGTDLIDVSLKTKVERPSTTVESLQKRKCQQHNDEKSKEIKKTSRKEINVDFGCDGQQLHDINAKQLTVSNIAQENKDSVLKDVDSKIGNLPQEITNTSERENSKKFVASQTLIVPKVEMNEKHFQENGTEINEKNLKDGSTIPEDTIVECTIDDQQSENINPKEPTPLNVIQKNTGTDLIDVSLKTKVERPSTTVELLQKRKRRQHNDEKSKEIKKTTKKEINIDGDDNGQLLHVINAKQLIVSKVVQENKDSGLKDVESKIRKLPQEITSTSERKNPKKCVALQTMIVPKVEMSEKHFQENGKEINEKNIKHDSTIPQDTIVECTIDGQQSENIIPKEATPLNVIQKNIETDVVDIIVKTKVKCPSTTVELLQKRKRRQHNDEKSKEIKKTTRKEINVDDNEQQLHYINAKQLAVSNIVLENKDSVLKDVDSKIRNLPQEITNTSERENPKKFVESLTLIVPKAEMSEKHFQDKSKEIKKTENADVNNIVKNDCILTQDSTDKQQSENIKAKELVVPSIQANLESVNAETKIDCLLQKATYTDECEKSKKIFASQTPIVPKVQLSGKHEDNSKQMKKDDNSVKVKPSCILPQDSNAECTINNVSEERSMVLKGKVECKRKTTEPLHDTNNSEHQKTEKITILQNLVISNMGVHSGNTVQEMSAQNNIKLKSDCTLLQQSENFTHLGNTKKSEKLEIKKIQTTEVERHVDTIFKNDSRLLPKVNVEGTTARHENIIVNEEMRELATQRNPTCPETKLFARYQEIKNKVNNKSQVSLNDILQKEEETKLQVCTKGRANKKNKEASCSRTLPFKNEYGILNSTAMPVVTQLHKEKFVSHNIQNKKNKVQENVPLKESDLISNEYISLEDFEKLKMNIDLKNTDKIINERNLQNTLTQKDPEKNNKHEINAKLNTERTNLKLFNRGVIMKCKTSNLQINKIKNKDEFRQTECNSSGKGQCEKNHNAWEFIDSSKFIIEDVSLIPLPEETKIEKAHLYNKNIQEPVLDLNTIVYQGQHNDVNVANDAKRREKEIWTIDKIINTTNNEDASKQERTESQNFNAEHCASEDQVLNLSNQKLEKKTSKKINNINRPQIENLKIGVEHKHVIIAENSTKTLLENNKGHDGIGNDLSKVNTDKQLLNSVFIMKEDIIAQETKCDSSKMPIQKQIQAQTKSLESNLNSIDDNNEPNKGTIGIQKSNESYVEKSDIESEENNLELDDNGLYKPKSDGKQTGDHEEEVVLVSVEKLNDGMLKKIIQNDDDYAFDSEPIIDKLFKKYPKKKVQRRYLTESSTTKVSRKRMRTAAKNNSIKKSFDALYLLKRRKIDNRDEENLKKFGIRKKRIKSNRKPTDKYKDTVNFNTNSLYVKKKCKNSILKDQDFQVPLRKKRELCGTTSFFKNDTNKKMSNEGICDKQRDEKKQKIAHKKETLKSSLTTFSKKQKLHKKEKAAKNRIKQSETKQECSSLPSSCKEKEKLDVECKEDKTKFEVLCNIDNKNFVNSTKLVVLENSNATKENESNLLKEDVGHMVSVGRNQENIHTKPAPDTLPADENTIVPSSIIITSEDDMKEQDNIEAKLFESQLDMVEIEIQHDLLESSKIEPCLNESKSEVSDTVQNCPTCESAEKPESINFSTKIIADQKDITSGNKQSKSDNVEGTLIEQNKQKVNRPKRTLDKDTRRLKDLKKKDPKRIDVIIESLKNNKSKKKNSRIDEIDHEEHVESTVQSMGEITLEHIQTDTLQNVSEVEVETLFPELNVDQSKCENIFPANQSTLEIPTVVEENQVVLLDVNNKQYDNAETSTTCEITENLIAVMFSEENRSKKTGFIFFKGCDHNYHSIGDPLLGGECVTNETDHSAENKEITSPGLENVLVNDNILPYISTLADNNLNQESSEDNGTDFQLLELIGNSLGRESSPPLIQTINCDNLYHSNLKQVELEFDESSASNAVEANNEVFINQFQQQTMSVENMSELMNVVLTSIQNLNNMTKPIPMHQQDANCKEGLFLPTDLELNEVIQETSVENLDLNCDFSQATSVEKSSECNTPSTPLVGTNYTGLQFLTIPRENPPSSENIGKKVIVEQIPQCNEEPLKEVPQEKPSVKLTKRKLSEAIAIAKLNMPVSNKKPLNNVGFVRNSSKTKPSAPKPKKVSEQTKELSNEMGTSPKSTKIVSTSNSAFKSPYAVSRSSPKERSLPLIEDLTSIVNLKTLESSIPDRKVNSTRKEDDVLKVEQKSQSPSIVQKLGSFNSPQTNSESDMIDNVKRRKRKAVDYSSIEKLLERDDLHKAQKLKNKIDDKSKEKKKDDDMRAKKVKCGDLAIPSTSRGCQHPGEKVSSSIFEDSDDDVPKKKKSKSEPQLEPDAMNALFDKLVQEGNINVNATTKVDEQPSKPLVTDLILHRKYETTPVKQIGVVTPIPRQIYPLKRELPNRSAYGEDGRSSSTYYPYYSERSRRSYSYSNRDSRSQNHQSNSRRTDYSTHSSDQRYSLQRSSGSSRSSRSSRHHSTSRSSSDQRNYW